MAAARTNLRMDQGCDEELNNAGLSGSSSLPPATDRNQQQRQQQQHQQQQPGGVTVPSGDRRRHSSSSRRCCRRPVVSIRSAMMLVAGLLVLISGLGPLALTDRMSDLLVRQVLLAMTDMTDTSRGLLQSLFDEMEASTDIAATGLVQSFPNTTLNVNNHNSPYWDLPFHQYFSYVRRSGFPFEFGVVFVAERRTSLTTQQVRVVVDELRNISAIYAMHVSEFTYPPQLTFITNYSQPVGSWDEFAVIPDTGSMFYRVSSAIGVLYGNARTGYLPWGPRFNVYCMMEFSELGKRIATMRSSIDTVGVTFVVVEEDTRSIAASTHPEHSATTYRGIDSDLSRPECLNDFGVVTCRHTVESFWPLFRSIYWRMQALNTSDVSHSTVVGAGNNASCKHLMNIGETQYLVAHTIFYINAMPQPIPFSVFAITTEAEQLRPFRRRVIVTVGIIVTASFIASFGVMGVVFLLTRSIRTVIRSMTHIAELGLLTTERTSSGILISEIAELDDAVIALNDELGRLKRFVPVSVRSTLFVQAVPRGGNGSTAAAAVANVNNESGSSASGKDSTLHSALNPLNVGGDDCTADGTKIRGAVALSPRHQLKGGREAVVAAAGAAAAAPNSDASTIHVAVLAIHLGSCNLFDEQTNQEYVGLVSTIVDVLVLCQASIEYITATCILASFRTDKCPAPAESACQCAISITQHVERKLLEGHNVGSDIVMCVDAGRCRVQPFAGRGILARILSGRPVDNVKRLAPLARFLGIRIMVTAEVAAACSYVTIIVDTVVMHSGDGDVRLMELVPVKQAIADPALLFESQRMRLFFSALLLGNPEDVVAGVTDRDSPRMQRLRRIARTMASHATAGKDVPGRGYVRHSFAFGGWGDWSAAATD